MDRTPLRRLIWPTIVLCLPLLLVFALLVAVNALALGHAILGAAAAMAGIGLMLRSALVDLDSVCDYLDRLPDAAGTAPPRLTQTGLLDKVSAALDRLHRVMADRGAGQQGDIGESGLDSLPDPVLMLDGERRLVRANAAARELLGHNLTGRDLASVIRNPALLQAADKVVHGDDSAEVEFAFHVPVERNFSARVARLPAPAPDGAAIVIALYDITAVKRAEEMRSDFVANASHELRTPISVLLGCIQTLRGSARDDPEAQAEFFGLMQAQATRMSGLVDDLLSLSRIEMNEHTVPSDAVDIAQIVGHVKEALAFNAQARGITIDVGLQGTLPAIAGDKSELTQVFQNLVDNAVKYGAEDSTVHIDSRLTTDAPPSLPGAGEYLAIAVRDEGEGIPAEHIPRLTERFYRVDTARSRELGGTGLGLAIVKHVVSRHRGALAISSTPGKGSVFTVFLPVAPPDDRDRKAARLSDAAGGPSTAAG